MTARAADQMKTLEVGVVYKAGVAAAELRRTPTGVRFRYRDDYRGPAIAFTLPQNGPPQITPAGAVPPFFAGLLPEGRRLQALIRATQTSADDDLSLLLAIGGDAIGDVQIMPEGQAPEPVRLGEQVDPSDLHFAEVFARVLARDSADPVGLPGVQDKISGRMITVPVHWGMTPAILKLNPREYPHLVENEAFFMQAARDSGISTAEVQLVHDADGAAGLVVRRFDRQIDASGAWHRLAQEDACQVLGRYPADKYRVSAEQVISSLSTHTGAPVVAARDLLQQMAFAYLSCNGDAHAKNFSIVQGVDAEWRVSPAYDIPSSHAYGDQTMAIRIGGLDREDIGRAQFLALGDAVGLPAKAVESVLDRLLKRLPPWLDRLDSLPYDQRKVHKLGKAIRYRAKRLS